MSSGNKCKECGTAIPADSPGGFCAQCLLGLGLKAESREQKAESREQEHAGTNPQIEAKEKSSLPVSAPLRLKPGDRIGRYRLLHELGCGGCGVVYMAEQEQPMRRKVAL